MTVSVTGSKGTAGAKNCRKPLMERLGREWLFFDGGTGTILQEKGLQGGEMPETWNLTRPEDIIDLYCGYLEAGCDIFNTNTFGANALKFPGSAFSESTVSQRGGPESAAPQTADPQNGSPESAAPQTGNPQSSGPESAAPQTGNPQNGSPESAAPQTGDPKDRTSQTVDPQDRTPQNGEPPEHEDLRRIVEAAVRLAQEARRRTGREDAYIALDIGPTGRLLEPLGDLPFERAVELFGEVVRIGAAAGADLVLIETMSDSYESKAAVLAAKENCDLPVLITNVYDRKGKLLTGGTVDSTVATLEGLGVDGLGVNCGLGPEQMIPVVQRLTETASVPILVNPNAGLPRTEHGKTLYDIDPDTFAAWMKKIAAMGVQAVGGCCGTTPDHIRKTVNAIRGQGENSGGNFREGIKKPERLADGRIDEGVPFRPNTKKHRAVVSSFSQAVEIGKKPVIIGERINPTGKKKFKEALRKNDLEYILAEGLRQEDSGAHILDVNVGLPEIDETAMMGTVVTRLQSILALPLQIDTSDPAAMERGMRLYNGKPMVNSVNGKRESMEAVFPLVKKYGGVVVGLTLDEGGIPDTADGRVAIAKKIYETAEIYGIPREDIVIDGLAMTISSDTKGALVTLETLRRVRDELNGYTILGVSNISFGLPERSIINAHFLTMAMQMGLSCAIMNPGNEDMMAAYRAFLALSDMDPQCMGYIGAYANAKRTVLSSGTVPQQRTSAERASTEGTSTDRTSTVKTSARGTQEEGTLPRGALQQGKTGQGAPEMADVKSSAAGMSLSESIRRGMAKSAAEAARERLKNGFPALDLINEELIPALDTVGKGFEAGTVFLPQLLMSAEAAKAAFEVVKETMQGQSRETKGRIILATVKGDIHDIGKNIVKVMLENYGYDIMDLGKDVDPETIVETAVRENIRLVGLSALMTTTVVSMEETIRRLRETKPDTKVVVGGAVMTREYADAIGADCYAPDAMATVHYAEEIFAVR